MCLNYGKGGGGTDAPGAGRRAPAGLSKAKRTAGDTLAQVYQSTTRLIDRTRVVIVLDLVEAEGDEKRTVQPSLAAGNAQRSLAAQGISGVGAARRSLFGSQKTIEER